MDPSSGGPCVPCGLIDMGHVTSRPGIAWHGIAWHGLAWHGLAWHGLAAQMSPARECECEWVIAHPGNDAASGTPGSGVCDRQAVSSPPGSGSPNRRPSRAHGPCHMDHVTWTMSHGPCESSQERSHEGSLSPLLSPALLRSPPLSSALEGRGERFDQHVLLTRRGCSGEPAASLDPDPDHGSWSMSHGPRVMVHESWSTSHGP